MANRFVVYQSTNGGWEGAVELLIGRWPFRKVGHAPVTHGKTASEVFDWLQKRYPDRVICHDPEVSKRYSREDGR